MLLFLPFALSKQHWQHSSHPQQASRQNPGWTQKLRSQHRDYLTTGYVVSRRFFTYCARGHYVVCPLSDCCLASFQLQLFPLYLVPSVFPLGVTKKYKDSSCFTSEAENKLPLWQLKFFSMQMKPYCSISGKGMKVRSRTPNTKRVFSLSAILSCRC